MPRGKFVNHKGRSRHFTNPEELEEERLKEQKKKSLKQTESDSESAEEEEEDEDSEGGDGEEDEEEDSESDGKPKGVSGLIEIENPNRVTKKLSQKVGRINLEEGTSKPELTRREQEQIQKQKARRQYMKLHAEGKTKQAREDLARLAIIKQHRAEAAARREQEKKEKEEARKKASNA
ncbi:28 kDa heat- and acid-stable phosphoprotein [Phlebotomus papatasi]|uniref:Casein kinase substrate phosphoprotein PP28 domain-containing protein n=1 Tax=Phlebotomus papatasi TaxID=29031 RepID=A0A1B0D7F0_PHLPP|nr:28 kDa heat- and acid-stable phosphoprotein [Phlebotomus papatasi]